MLEHNNCYGELEAVSVDEVVAILSPLGKAWTRASERKDGGRVLFSTDHLELESQPTAEPGGANRGGHLFNGVVDLQGGRAGMDALAGVSRALADRGIIHRFEVFADAEGQHPIGYFHHGWPPQGSMLPPPPAAH
jgi:hypothetical protein